MSDPTFVIADEAPAGAFESIFADAGVVATDVASAARLADLFEPLPSFDTPTHGVLVEISRERSAQDAKWGEQNHPNGTGTTYDMAKADIARGVCDANTRKGSLTWRHILEEKVAETFSEFDGTKLREELLQVAAVATAWVEAIDRKAAAK